MAFGETDILHELSAIVRALAALPSPISQGPCDSAKCPLCQMYAPKAIYPINPPPPTTVHFGDEYPNDPVWHAPQCPWRLAVEWKTGQDA